MTRDEILSMTVKQIEPLVVEHVFGAKWYNRGGRNFLLCDIDTVEWDGQPGRIESTVPDYIGGFGYASNLIKAWLVVDAMAENGWWFGLNNVIPNSDPIVYEVKFDKADKFVYDCDENVSLAICRAALLAVTGAK